MKSIVVLILGCVPLTVLTLAAIVGLDESRSSTPLLNDSKTRENVDVQTFARHASELAPTVESLLQSDPLRPQPLPTVISVPSGSPLQSMAGDWLEWGRTRELIGGTLAAEALTSGQTPADRERIARQLDELTGRFDAHAPSGSEPLLAALADRARELRQQIGRERSRHEGRSLFQLAQQELAQEHYLPCLALCERLLSPAFKDCLGDDADKIRTLQHRAQFGRDAQRAAAALRAADSEPRQLDILQSLVDAYGSSAGLSASESAVLENYRHQLRAMSQRQDAERQARRAQQTIDLLEKDLPADFESRLRRAVEIMTDFPAMPVRTRLGAAVRGWISDFLPEKTLQEPGDIREAETTGGEIVRGYFQPVNDADGRLAGYQRYPTLEQLRRPVSAVGTFPRSGLKSPPQASLPRRCVDRYGQTRAQVLQSPHDAQQWTRLAELCRQLDRDLAGYYAMPGASQERVSFAAESRLAAAAAKSPAIGQLKRLFTP